MRLKKPMDWVLRDGAAAGLGGRTTNGDYG
jgi:hypothetical protein